MGERRKKEALSQLKLPEDTPSTTAKVQPQAEKPRGQTRISRRLKALIVWTSTLTGLLGGFVIFRPNVTVEPEFLRNDREPFSAYFRIQNLGNFEIYDVNFSCDLTGGLLHNVTITGFSSQTPEASIGSGGSTTKDCGVGHFPFSGKAYLDFTVRFRPSFWPWKIEKIEPFSAIRDEKGIVHWTHETPSSK
jgi:hypothetical protein